VTEEEYAAEVAYQRLLAAAEVQTLLMQFRLDVLYRGAGKPYVVLRHDRLEAEGVAVWQVGCEMDSGPLWDAVSHVRPMVDTFPG